MVVDFEIEYLYHPVAGIREQVSLLGSFALVGPVQACPSSPQQPFSEINHSVTSSIDQSTDSTNVVVSRCVFVVGADLLTPRHYREAVNAIFSHIGVSSIRLSLTVRSRPFKTLPRPENSAQSLRPLSPEEHQSHCTQDPNDLLRIEREGNTRCGMP